jgi:beta-glucosidase
VPTRRSFLAASAAFAALPRLACAASLPKDFLWGASTSALQIEGAVAEDGRGASIWETFAKRPGAIMDGSHPDVACDHYHRWPEDVALMKSLGLGAYRFSIAWPRVLPGGTGKVNAKGLDFYDRLVDGLLKAGVRPMACLYHWDLPQPLQDKGGWLNRDMAGWMSDYALAAARRLGDRVKDWFALNEPSVSAIFGHGYAEHAPGLNGGAPAILAALHHQNLAQGRTLAALRAENKGWALGTVLSLQPIVPASDRPEDAAAAIRWDAVWNRVPLDGVMRGLPPDILADAMVDLIKPGDMESIRFPLDVLGVNYYSPLTIQHQPGRAFDAWWGVPRIARRTAMDWPVEPGGLLQVLTELKELYGNPNVLITETGAAFDDHPQGDGVADPERTAFLADHLNAVIKARQAGCKVGGYFVWSLLDNWEWQYGYSRRFGITYIDYASQRRMPKDSFRWYAKRIKEGVA